ncbi:exodeoxyribonuclease V subunit gamma [Glaciecola sp. XM2]|uniref:exodeoxyribonuclease V subunit gamma n=1 Tax=Glaciecola sp. XM2 TaxID=1914931 RepID=UPI001BDE7B77|nr:exodeoxyribonuclease V subunit gamma [Glaciecola sp. XM2]MBT1449753.1 exodeoxyribonuclease V subunit gamma [Glaciecola sp. XM2]
MMSSAPPKSGFYSYHANRLEDLRAIVVTICKTDPLAPLQNDMCLVQSNGIAQWLKLGLAQSIDEGGLGIAAGMDFSLPSTFIWRVYRAFLPTDEVPDQSPLDKDPLLWRIYRLLETLPKQSEFKVLKTFLDGSNPEIRRFQLAERLALLFDQYQVYRADWLANWQQQIDSININGVSKSLDAENVWQAQFWRAILDDVGHDLASTSRSSVHSLFMQAAKVASEPMHAELLPKRIFVFGVSAMPKQILEALQLVSKFTQVVFCVANPCQYYWGDIVSHRDLIAINAHKQRANQHEYFANIPLDEMHNHANPILATLGKQGRDYIRLLEQFDGTQGNTNAHIPIQRQDVFYPYGDEDSPYGATLLHQLQNDIFHLTPIAELIAKQRTVNIDDDTSIVFHEVHSEQRELEVLHDQLLDAFNQDPSLLPSDILVMTPDINKYAPHINAVFGLFDATDKRAIPFTISDQGLRHVDPNVIAFEALLSLTDSRFTYSELMSLLELPAIGETFGFSLQDLDVIKHWVQGANIRWGLDANQRTEFVPMQASSVNTWQAGLRAMLLGYSMGDSGSWQGHLPYAEVGGLEASLIGNLAEFLDALADLKSSLDHAHTAVQWQTLVRDLIDTFFASDDITTVAVMAQINRQLDKLVSNINLAHATDVLLPVNTVKEWVLAGLDAGTLNHRFLMGKVNFATLMPMRAIPFKRVYLLGMNDGAFPRSNKPVDFDLMANDYRPGDRSIREDDRYLFLEALLAAREALYVSWVGRSIKDDSVRPPSTLVSQLLTYIDKFWTPCPNDSQDRIRSASLSDMLRSVHPLQAFSERYFPQVRDKWFTFAHEWRDTSVKVHQNAPELCPQRLESVMFVPPEGALTIQNITSFMKKPVEAFFHWALQIRFDDDDRPAGDDETFELDNLHRYAVDSRLIEQAILNSQTQTQLIEHVNHTLHTLAQSGELGLASTTEVLSQTLKHDMFALGQRYLNRIQLLNALDDWRIDINETFDLEGGNQIVIEDSLGGFWQDGEDVRRVVVAYSKTSKKRHKNLVTRFDALLQHWLEHVIGHLSAQPFTTEILAKERDFGYEFSPLSAIDAKALLTDILKYWQLGMTEPLKLESAAGCELASAIRAKPEAVNITHAVDAFERSLEFDNGYYTRAFGQDIDIVSFVEDEAFSCAARALYLPMVEACKELSIGQ